MTVKEMQNTKRVKQIVDDMDLFDDDLMSIPYNNPFILANSVLAKILPELSESSFAEALPKISITNFSTSYSPSEKSS